MTTLGLLLLFAGSVGGAGIHGIHDALTKGLCLCVADNDIYARDGRKSQSVTWRHCYNTRYCNVVYTYYDESNVVEFKQKL